MPDDPSEHDETGLDPTESREPSADEGIEKPRFSLTHVLVWLGLVAVCLAVERGIFDNPSTDNDRLASEVQNAVIAATGVGSLFLWWRRRMRGITFPTEPGEWMLVVMGLQYVLTPLIRRIVQVNLADDAYVGLLVYTVLRASPAVLPIVYSRDFSVRIYFAVQIALEAAKRCMLVLARFDHWAAIDYLSHETLLPLALLGYVLWCDHLHNEKRGWVHWLGIVVTAVPLLISLRQHVIWFLH